MSNEYLPLMIHHSSLTRGDMAKKFYTEKDVEDMFRGGTLSLEVNDDVVLTELAYEKARSLGMNLLRDKPDHPPSAPVRPYISKTPGSRPTAPAAPQAPAPKPPPDGRPPEDRELKANLQQRIREAVVARLGAKVDATLLDVIIRRVLSSTGVR
jgi:hypothetical protein